MTKSFWDSVSVVSIELNNWPYLLGSPATKWEERGWRGDVECDKSASFSCWENEEGATKWREREGGAEISKPPLHTIFSYPWEKFCTKHSPIIDWPLTLCHKQGIPSNRQWRLQRGRGSGGHCLVSFFPMAAPGSVDSWRSWRLFSCLFPMPT